MQSSVIGEIRRIQAMAVSELQVEWARLYGGELCRSRNRTFLVKRLCWRAQELRLGGLSDRARARVAELAPDSFIRACPPRTHLLIEAPPAEPPPRPKSIRDARLPSPGSVLIRRWRDQEVRVAVFQDAYEWNGRRFSSLSEVARAVTGQHWSGPLFFGLRQRSRK